MENNSSIVSELEGILIEESKKVKGEIVNQEFISVNSYYNDLVKKGLLKKRGYTLRGIEDIHLFNVKLNGHQEMTK